MRPSKSVERMTTSPAVNKSTELKAARFSSTREAIHIMRGSTEQAMIHGPMILDTDSDE
jgi:hypothetical protein